MQRNFDNKDFEQFLKQNADQYRMYPSDKVWKEIHNSLHSRRRWTGVAALLLLVTGAIVTSMMVLNPSSDKPVTNIQTKTNSQPLVAKPVSTTSNVPVLNTVNTNAPISLNKIPSIILESPIQQKSEDLVNNTTIASMETPTIVAEPIKDNQGLTAPVYGTSDVLTKSSILLSPLLAENLETNNLSSFVQSTPASISGEFSPLFTMTQSKTIAATQKSNGRKKIDLQLYFTPGISYRRLTENKEVILAASGSSSISTNIALEDVKNVVKHKPDIGFELGLAANYPLSKRISVKAGVQFNVNKYDIRAFSYYGEPATIAMQGGGPVQQTVTTTSYYRNSSGYRPNWLSNVYFSLSVPVGAELRVVNNKKLDLGFGITAQPTYLLDNRAFMISTDYKNYVKVPDLIRRWNVNTGAELFVGLKSGKTRWQIGPQVRYQTLSSFKDKYPVKENLFNFGLKVGVTLNQ